MICNLNQMSFQEYGVIHPERGPEARRSKDLPNTQFLSLTQGPVQVYYTRSDTWICCRDGPRCFPCPWTISTMPIIISTSPCM